MLTALDHISLALKLCHFPMIQGEVCRTHVVFQAYQFENTHNLPHSDIEIFQQNAYLNHNCEDYVRCQNIGICAVYTVYTVYIYMPKNSENPS